MSLDIRVNPSHKVAFKKAYDESKKIDKNNVKLNFDEAVEEAVIMIHHEGSFQEWFRGYDKCLGFIVLGYVPASTGKFCPLLRDFFGNPKKCMGEKCAHYVVQRQIGDCGHYWSGIKP